MAFGQMNRSVRLGPWVYIVNYCAGCSPDGPERLVTSRQIVSATAPRRPRCPPTFRSLPRLAPLMHRRRRREWRRSRLLWRRRRERRRSRLCVRRRVWCRGWLRHWLSRRDWRWRLEWRRLRCRPGPRNGLVMLCLRRRRWGFRYHDHLYRVRRQCGRRWAAEHAGNGRLVRGLASNDLDRLRLEAWL
jgi:hypothetical protein